MSLSCPGVGVSCADRVRNLVWLLGCPSRAGRQIQNLREPRSTAVLVAASTTVQPGAPPGVGHPATSWVEVTAKTA